MKRIHRRVRIVKPITAKFDSFINLVDKGNPLTPRGTKYVFVVIIGVFVLWLFVD